MEARKKAVPPNMKIKPNPLGGPGYADICLSPYPSYSHEPYDRIDRVVGKSKCALYHRFRSDLRFPEQLLVNSNAQFFLKIHKF